MRNYGNRGTLDTFLSTVLTITSFRFHFYSDDGIEPGHFHVRTRESRFWLDPGIGLAI